MESSEEQPRNYLYIFGGYAVVLGGAYVYYRYSQRDGQRGKPATTSDRTAAPTRGDLGPLRGRRQDGDRNTDGAARRRRNNRPAAPANPFEVLTVETPANEPEEDTQDLAYAESMARLREGNKLTTSKVKGARNKTVKQSTLDNSAAQPAPPAVAADGTDEAASAANKQPAAARHLDVSDMLEPGPKAPTSLRIAPKGEKPVVVPENGWETVAKPKKEPGNQPKPAAAAAAETKKQRQNKKKAEETKAQVAAAERAREALAENQRRQARIARGEAAKDGSKQTAQAINRWNERELNGGAVQAPVVPAPEPAMLDTYHQDGLPDEQEQLRRLAEDDPTSWNTVTDKKKSKRKQPKADAEETAAEGAVKENIEPKPHGANGANGINGIKIPKIAGPPEGTSDDGGWSVV